MSTFWSLWIIGLTIIFLALITWLLFSNRRVALKDDEEPENRTTGHVYDGIEEYDNPLPRWWFQLFVITIIYSIVYLIWYPGLGAFKGLGGWTSVNELERDQEKALEGYADTFDRYLGMSIDELAHDGKAMKMGVRLFANNCSVCHGADGGGNYSFPDLTDKDWLYGGSPKQIKHSITHGRQGTMPAWGAVIGEEKVLAVSEYVLTLSGQTAGLGSVEQGAVVFQQYCGACHGPEGKGDITFGAPNLTDEIWLYSGEPEAVAQSIRSGRSNSMPAQQDKLRDYKIHILAAYVYGMSLDY